MTFRRGLDHRAGHLIAMVAFGAVALGACSDADPDAPTVTEGVLPPAGTEDGRNVGEIEDPIDEDITGGGSTG